MNNKKILFVSFLIVAVPFIITRLPFFIDYPALSVDPDYLHYYTILDQVDKGFFPTFIIRTPGYPLFLGLIFAFFSRNMAVVVVQNLLSLMTALFFVFVIYKVYSDRLKYLPLLAAVGMAAFTSSNNHLMADTTLLTESLFVNMIILFFAFLILNLRYNKNVLWLLCSFSMAYAILIRPTGMFLIPVFLIVLVSQFLKTRKEAPFLRVLLHFIKRKETLSFSLPFICILLLLSAYNYVTVGHFTVTGIYSEHALISFTATFLEKKDTYEPGINKMIDETRQAMKRRHKKTRDNSWDYVKLNRVLRKYYNANRDLIFTYLLSLEEEDTYTFYLKWRPLLKDMGWTAIKKHPILYLKYFYSNLAIYFFHNMSDSDFYGKLKKKYLNAKTHKSYCKKYIAEGSSIRRYYKKTYAKTISDDFIKSYLKETWEPRTLPVFKIINEEKKDVHIEPTFLLRVHRVYKKIHDFLFRNILWIFIFLFVFCYSFVRLIKSRFRHTGSLIMFSLTLSALLHGVIICMLSFAIQRYSYTMEFVYYLSLFLFPITLKLPPAGLPAGPLFKKSGAKTSD